ncbi:heme-binding domain-containing protein [Robiginitalea aurantiaca]|uniref:Heme-binding domain-containing protein n=1 Tax=Robiginitalea aurantiaca TaxID=3056915 RepID=A0ABT7WCA1_9FLAO|nr:heme-binding domain-containing protein [Robiginitalea aurantiaca]MDM9630552.1 heme-binding domain-containing protein [Robiginitalea aurantiaca]
MKLGKKIGWTLLILFIAIQFYRPEKNNAPATDLDAFLAETSPSDEVEAVLKSSCYDCHSNTTNYPWYNQVAPVSWWLADHIEDGKEHLNFAAWEQYSSKKKDHKLEEVVETVESGEMPLDEYTWTHEDARLTDAQREAIIAWANKTRAIYQVADLPK